MSTVQRERRAEHAVGQQPQVCARPRLLARQRHAAGVHQHALQRRVGPAQRGVVPAPAERQKVLLHVPLQRFTAICCTDNDVAQRRKDAQHGVRCQRFHGHALLHRALGECHKGNAVESGGAVRRQQVQQQRQRRAANMQQPALAGALQQKRQVAAQRHAGWRVCHIDRQPVVAQQTQPIVGHGVLERRVGVKNECVPAVELRGRLEREKDRREHAGVVDHKLEVARQRVHRHQHRRRDRQTPEDEAVHAVLQARLPEKRRKQRRRDGVPRVRAARREPQCVRQRIPAVRHTGQNKDGICQRDVK